MTGQSKITSSRVELRSDNSAAVAPQIMAALTAANVGLVVAVVLLTVHGWLAGRAARLRGRRLLLATSIAAALGLVMILLKDLVLIHLH